MEDITPEMLEDPKVVEELLSFLSKDERGVPIISTGTGNAVFAISTDKDGSEPALAVGFKLDTLKTLEITTYIKFTSKEGIDTLRGVLDDLEALLEQEEER